MIVFAMFFDAAHNKPEDGSAVLVADDALRGHRKVSLDPLMLKIGDILWRKKVTNSLARAFVSEK